MNFNSKVYNLFFSCFQWFHIPIIRIKWILWISISACPFTANGTIYYISKTGTPNGPGLTWATAFDHFITALAKAQPEDTLFIGEGIYQLPQDKRVFITKGICMFGGFAGWETTPEERLTGVHLTTIRSTGFYSKLVLDSLYVPSILDGLIFRDGDSYNCGMYCDEPCYITDSECWGGILYIRTSPVNSWRDLLIQDCVFENNQAHFGGAIGIDNFEDSRSHIRFIRCLFKDNVSGPYGRGGAILYRSQASAHTAVLILDSCVFRGNSTYYDGGAGVYIETHGTGIDSIVISNSQFENGTAWHSGGCGILLDNRVIHPLENLFVNRCVFSGNVNFVPNKASWTGGSAMHLRNGGQVSECLFIENRGVWSPVLAGYSMNVNNCLFANNRNSKGNATILSVGEWQNYGFTPFSNKFNNCTFVNNTADTILPLIYRYYPLCQDTLVNCVIYGNSNTKQSPIIVDKWADFSTFFVAGIGGDSRPDLFYYVEEDGSTDFNTLIDTWWEDDPLFVDTATLNFRLKRCSPFINKGLNEFTIGSYDLDGLPRSLEDSVDLGAYERLSFAPEIDYFPVTCAHLPDGMLIYEDPGITPPGNWTIQDTFGIHWDNGLLNKGIYSAVLEDSEGCSREFEIFMDGPDSIRAWFSIIGSSQSMPEGSIRLDSIKGGTPDYFITWFNGTYGNEIQHLFPGIYSVEIADKWGCRLELELEVPLLTSFLSSKSPTEFHVEYLYENGYLFYKYIIEPGRSGQIPFEFISVNGQVVCSGIAEAGEHQIWLGQLPAGMYLWILSLNGITQTFTVMVP